MCGVAFISGCSSVQFGVLFVGNGLTPFVAAIFAGNFHSNVAEPAVGLGTVPVLDWLNQLSALAPCQCLTLAGMVITVPGVRLTAGLPSSWN